MRIHHGLPGLRSLQPGAVLSVGNYDGIHLGHQKLLERARAARDQANTRIAVVTFEPHPLTVLKPEVAPPRLTPPVVKQQLLESAGVDDYVILPPAPEVLNLSAEAFWQILRDEVKPSRLIEGRSFNFGKARAGTIDRLRTWAGEANVPLEIVDSVRAVLLDLSIVEVNSSLIRWLIAHGRARDAALCLGRPYTLHGTVIKGFQRGRTIGVPTANLKCDDQLIPADGVYAGKCARNGKTYATAVSIGSLPSFEERKFQIEAHLIDFAGDLYDQPLEVELTDWLRDQRKFLTLDTLKAQLARDLKQTASRTTLEPARPIAAAV